MHIKSLFIELTSQCNFRCRTCYNRSGLATPSFLPWKLLKDLLDTIDTDTAIHCAGGEPLLYPHLEELLSYIEVHPRISFSFITNGSIPKILPYYKCLSNLKLQVSLDGSCEEINARIRGTGNFEPTFRFIKEAASIRPVSCHMVIGGWNTHDVEPFYRLIADLGCRPLFTMAVPSGSAVSHWPELALTPNQHMEVLKKIETLNIEYALDIPIPYSTHHCPLMDSDAPWNLLITSDGRVQPCQSLHDPTFTLGSLELLTYAPDSILQAMYNLQAMALSRSKNDYQCTRCLTRTRCDRGCPALAFLHHQDFMSCDEQCTFRKQEFLHFLKLQLPKPS